MKNTKILNKTIRFLENSINRLDSHLVPWQVTGLTDGEGGFYCS